MCLLGMKMVGRIRSELKLEPSCGYKTSFCAKRVLAVSWQTADFKVLWWSWFQPLAQEPKTLFYAWAQYMSTFVLKVCLWALKNKKNRPALVTRVGWGRVHIVQVSLVSVTVIVFSHCGYRQVRALATWCHQLQLLHPVYDHHLPVIN